MSVFDFQVLIYVWLVGSYLFTIWYYSHNLRASLAYLKRIRQQALKIQVLYFASLGLVLGLAPLYWAIYFFGLTPLVYGILLVRKYRSREANGS